MRKEIFSQCRMTFCEGITSIDVKLFGAVTQIGFKITSVSPLIVESNSTSKEELLKLADVLTSSSEPQGSSSNAASSNSCFLLSKCQLTVSEDIKSIDFTLFNAVTQAGFKIIRVNPLAIEKDSTSREDLARIADLLTSNDDIQESSTNATSMSAGSSSSKGHEQQEDTSGSTTEESNSAYKVNIPEPEIEDYVMKKHHFHLFGEYYFDRDWKELFGKAEETDEGFRFRVNDVSADEYRMLQNLKKIAFETISIPVGEAHRVKEAAEYINCVDHGVCVINYNSRPYIVGPKAQVHAAKEEILYTLREDGVDCHLTSLKTLATQNDSEDKERNIDNNSVDKVNAGIDIESTSSSETESDAESDTVEYIMGKNDFRLAKQYFEGRPEHQYFDKAAKRKGGYLFSFSSQATDCTLFIRTLRRLNFEAVSHRENDKLKVRSIADELKCGDLDVKVLEKGSTLFLVGPKEKVAEVKQKIISKLQDTDEDGKDMKIREKSKRQGSQSDSAPCQYNMPSYQPGVSQQTEAASIFPQASNGLCVTGIKDNAHDGNIGEMSFKAQTMPEVKNPRGYEDSNGGFGVEGEDKVKDITSSNTAMHHEETARDSKMQAIPTSITQAGEPKKQSWREGHGMGSDDSMDDISDVDSLGSDIDKHTPPNSGTKVIGCDAGKSESKEQMFAKQELVEGIGQVQGPQSITRSNQHVGIEYSEDSDVPQMTFRHERVVNQDVTSDVKITPVDRSNIITDNRGNLSEVELNEASAVIKVKDDRNAARDDQRYNLHHTDQQARKVQDQHQVGEPNQQRGYISDEGDKHERELSHGVQIRQNRPSEVSQQDIPRTSLERSGEQVVEQLGEEGAKGQTEAKHHSDDTAMMKDGEKQLYDQDRLDRLQPDTDSDEGSGSIEYVRKKTLFKLAKQYFKGCIDHRYFDEAEISEIRFLISTNNKNTDQARILKALCKLKFERVGDVEDVKPQLKKIADQLKCTDSTVKLLELGSKSYLVGPEKNIARVKQAFISHIQETVKALKNVVTSEMTRRQRNQPDMSDATGSFSGTSNGGARPKEFKGIWGENPYSNSTRNESEDTQAERSGKVGRDENQGVYTGHHSDIKVHIHKTDITKFPVDCIVNATNARLKHFGGHGVARVIAKAAGKELQEACEKFVSSGNTVEVTGVFVSPGGRLPAKHVLHAVGPKWDLYTDKKKCIDDLRRTVLRCLAEAMRLGMSSIALPSISAATFKVPKDLCALSYMKAVKSFDAIFGQDKDCTLKEIHFVDVDDIMVNHIQKSFMKYWEEPCNAHMEKMDERLSQDYLSSKMPLPPINGASSTCQSSEIQGHQTKGLGESPAPQAKPPTTGRKTIENESEYQTRGIIQPRISGDATPKSNSMGAKASKGKSDYANNKGSSGDKRLVCGTCFCPKETVKPTLCCKKLLCKDCHHGVTYCPYRTKQRRIRTGNQPDGYMSVSFTSESADGFESGGSWKIKYSFPPGTQTIEHPNPGKRYSGTEMIGYIPDTEDSMDLLKLLRLAFIRRLTFTIGVSQTAGQDKITWNDINHKTKLLGGNFDGFPDATYFTRVIQELKDKEVTLENMTETEVLLIRKFQNKLSSFRWFSDSNSGAFI